MKRAAIVLVLAFLVACTPVAEKPATHGPSAEEVKAAVLVDRLAETRQHSAEWLETWEKVARACDAGTWVCHRTTGSTAALPQPPGCVVLLQKDTGVPLPTVVPGTGGFIDVYMRVCRHGAVSPDDSWGLGGTSRSFPASQRATTRLSSS
jgi:hypothetical protein